MHRWPHEFIADLDPDFTCTFQPLDDLPPGQRYSTYWDVEPLMRGPQPVPDWLVTSRAAVDTELGVLKTGKEAEVFLLERAVPAGLEHEGASSCVLAAKRYRALEHRTFHRNASYTEGRRVRNTRDARAMAKKSAFGRQVESTQWAWAEWDSLQRCHAAGVPVPYPVQIDGTEILMELVTVDGEPAPRLAGTRPAPDLLAHWFDQLRGAMTALARHGLAHGDLSPYNVLAAGERLVIIDLPQVVDLVANPQGADFLQRDCHNVCTWFARRGLEVDEHALFADLMASAW
ncbi:MAG TPA: RIO1 family regulatory kinase/ATPase [Marmoricola sp.]|nr:RIO1 family regulatory kinase/ATPase [Marmoricola sp.]